MYSEACEAQGMTLADLLKKQAEETRPTYSYASWDKAENRTIEAALNDGDWVFWVINDTGVPQHIFWQNADTHTDLALEFDESMPAHEIRWRPELGTIMVNSAVDALTVTLRTYPVSTSAYYSAFGLSKVELPEDCTNVAAMWDDVCTRVNEKYWKRYLSCETLEEWQVELQVLTDAIVRRYERALRLYSANADAIEKEFGARQVTEYGDLKDTSEQTKDSKTNTTVSATPDQKINDDETYAGTTSNGSSNAGTTEHTRTGKITVTQVGGDSMIGAINDNVAKWHDIETELVDEYAHVFMSYIWS